MTLTVRPLSSLDVNSIFKVVSIQCSVMPEKVIDISALFPEKIEIKECHGRREEVNRDDLLNVDDKNWNTIVCRRCGSVIFPEDRVQYIEGEL
ncbi:unnamed protein product [Strongylus vulgaris]|uniref:Uncharacterized protein n=1 Tax=Strongylus vulgaris TaxID=40348 RepID=A0A3P7KPA7_STRVU|nr:unnamed protein product [Strongylus vulgaris]